MKKLTLLFLILVATVANAQIKRVETAKREEIGKIAPMGSMSMILEQQGNTYIITYRDVKYTSIDALKSFTFEETGTDLDNLYNMIMDGFENTPESDIKIELPNDTIWLHFEKAMGIVNFQFIHAESKLEIYGYSQFLNKKQVTKLFGKKKKK